MRSLIAILCLLVLQGLAIAKPSAEIYQFQLLGFKSPSAKAFSGISVCDIKVELQDDAVVKKKQKQLTKVLKRQFNKYILADGRLALDQSSNCRSLTFVIKHISDVIVAKNSTAYADIHFDVAVLSEDKALLTGLDFSSRYIAEKDIFKELDEFYIYSVREKSHALSSLLEKLVDAIQQRQGGQTHRLSRRVDMEKLSLSYPAQLYREQAYDELVSEYSMQQVSDSYIRLDAYCSALLALGDFTQFFSCIKQWDSASFALITGYQAYDADRQLLPELSIANQVKSLVHAPTPISESLFQWEVVGRKYRLLCEAWFRLGNYQKSQQHCDRALKLFRPNHQLWTAPSKRYKTSPQAKIEQATALALYWAFPGGSNTFYWSTDILFTASLAAQSNLHLHGNQTDNSKYLEYIDSVHLTLEGQEYQKGVDRLRILFKNPIYFLAKQYDKITFMSVPPSKDMEAVKAAGLQIFGAVAKVAGFIAIFADDDYQGLDEELFAIGDNSDAIAADLVAPSYFDAIAYRESYQRAYILFQQGQYQAALQEVTAVLNDNIRANEKELYWHALMLLGQCLNKLGQLEQAQQSLQKAITVLEQLKGNISIEAQKVGFLANKDSVYEQAMQIAISQQDYAKALLLSEQARARALVDLMADTFDRRKLAILEGQLQQTITHSQSNNTDELRELAIERRLRGLVKRKSAKQEAENDVTSTRSIQIPSFAELQAQLDTDDVAIVYAKVLEQLVALKVTRKTISYHQIEVQDLHEQVRIYLQQLQDSASRDYLSLSQSLYKKLIAPLHIVENKQLYIVKSGSLNYLPFASLHDGSVYLAQRNPIRIIPSLTTLTFIPENVGPERLLGIGNPTGDLPGAEQEVKIVSQGFARQTTLFGADANVANFKQLADSHNIIHLAMHGIFDSGSTSGSHLLFAGQPSPHADDAFYLGEVLDLELNADLVVLSACETGLNEVSSGDEIIGFTRSFLQAGANNIISTLWKVDDIGTYQLMTRFYANLAQHQYYVALQRAQVELINSQYSHPFYWSAFTFSGRG